MGIDLTIRNTKTNSTFNVPSALAKDVIDGIMKRRDSKWRTIGTPVLNEALDDSDIQIIRTTINEYNPDNWPTTDVIEFKDDLNEWLTDVIGNNPITDNTIILEAY